MVISVLNKQPSLAEAKYSPLSRLSKLIFEDLSLPYYRKLTLVFIKVLEISATQINAN